MRRNEHYALFKAQAMLEAPEKTLLFEDVSRILTFMRELQMTGFTVYGKLSKLFDSQKEWRAKITGLLKAKQPPKLDALTTEMRSYRIRERGVALMHTRMCELKRLFQEKATCEDLIKLFNEDLSQTVFNNSRYIERLTQKYLWVTEFDDLPQALE